MGAAMGFELTGYITAPDGVRCLKSAGFDGGMTLIHQSGIRVEVPASISAAANKTAAIDEPLPFETKAAIGWIVFQMMQATQGRDNDPGAPCLPH